MPQTVGSCSRAPTRTNPSTSRGLGGWRKAIGPHLCQQRLWPAWWALVSTTHLPLPRTGTFTMTAAATETEHSTGSGHLSPNPGPACPDPVSSVKPGCRKTEEIESFMHGGTPQVVPTSKELQIGMQICSHSPCSWHPTGKQPNTHEWMNG